MTVKHLKWDTGKCEPRGEIINKGEAFCAKM